MEELFANVSDPRVQGRCLHKLYDVLFIGLCTILANGEDFEDMVEFGHQRIEWHKSSLIGLLKKEPCLMYIQN